MEQVALASLGIAVVTLLFVRSLRLQVHSLRSRVDDLEGELDALSAGDAS